MGTDQSCRVFQIDVTDKYFILKDGQLSKVFDKTLSFDDQMRALSRHSEYTCNDVLFWSEGSYCFDGWMEQVVPYHPVVIDGKVLFPASFNDVLFLWSLRYEYKELTGIQSIYKLGVSDIDLNEPLSFTVFTFPRLVISYDIELRFIPSVEFSDIFEFLESKLASDIIKHSGYLGLSSVFNFAGYNSYCADVFQLLSNKFSSIDFIGPFSYNGRVIVFCFNSFWWESLEVVMDVNYCWSDEIDDSKVVLYDEDEGIVVSRFYSTFRY